ncbi:PAS domain S-box protein [uncultured Methanospirillum sp.]|uniref:PAS domain S-box protein n=1 Tax=uncultured Methanospirillum sp. TaxID=262503 RepID=UPI0029C92C21|nr:PAS domain S-box protein [uncultured Methanospirillum sp.]
MLTSCRRIVILRCGCSCSTPIQTETPDTEIIIPDLFRDILLPESFVDSYRRDGAYFMVPDNFSDIEDFFRCQGFSTEDIPGFLSDSISSILITDTQIQDHDLNPGFEFAKRNNIPVTVVPVGTGPLYKYIKTQYLECLLLEEREKNSREISESHKKLADYAMMVDLLGEISMVQHENQTIQKIIDLFLTLFSPQKIGFLPVVNNTPENLVTSQELQPDPAVISEFLNTDDDYIVNDSGTGFFLRIRYIETTLGVLIIEGFSVSEHIQDYLDIGTFIAKVCGLSLMNARIYQQLDSTITDLHAEIAERKRAQALLYESESRFRSLVESTSDMIWEITLDGRCTYVSPKIFDILGYTQEEVIDRKIFEFMSPGELDRISNLFTFYIRDKTPIRNLEILSVHKDGHEIIIESNGEPIIDQSGILIGFRGINRDITARKQIEDALKQSEERYRLLFQNMLEGFAYCQIISDDNGNVIDWVYLDVNDAFERHTGVHQILGKRGTDVFPDMGPQLPEFIERYNRISQTGVPEKYETYYPGTDSWFLVSLYQQKKDHFVLVFENITPQKRAEEQLRNIIREYQTILENVPVWIIFKDINNRYVRVNPAAARIIGKSIADIEGNTMSELFPRVASEFYNQDLEVIQTKKPKIGVLEEIITANGEHIWVQTDTVPLFNDLDDVIGLLVVCTDITERKRSRDALNQINHKLNLLSGITRHDIGNELQVIFGYLGLLEGTISDPEMKKFMDLILNAAHHIERQIAFTRDYQDIGVHSPTWQNLNLVISQIVKSLNIAPIQVINEISGIEIYADPLIGKVFFNLIDNATRYGEKITQIRLFGSVENDQYMIICEDDGVGVPEEFKLKIFKREYYKHTGFGLNLSREILDITGITISERGVYGVGARFEIVVSKDGWRYGK